MEENIKIWNVTESKSLEQDLLEQIKLFKKYADLIEQETDGVFCGTVKFFKDVVKLELQYKNIYGPITDLFSVQKDTKNVDTAYPGWFGVSSALFIADVPCTITSIEHLETILVSTIKSNATKNYLGQLKRTLILNSEEKNV